jgi:hypothetical protein
MHFSLREGTLRLVTVKREKISQSNSVHPRSLLHTLDSPWKDYEMRKGFTRKPQADEPATPVKNYITRSGLDRLKDEHRFLLTRERPAVTATIRRVILFGVAGGVIADFVLLPSVLVCESSGGAAAALAT